jgi:hypothetical protein
MKPVRRLMRSRLTSQALRVNSCAATFDRETGQRRVPCSRREGETDVPYGKTSLRAEQRALREKMRALGLSHRQIAVEFARRYGLRPRAAWRHAYGWSLKEAAEQINSRAGDTGLDPCGNAAMTGPHLCEYENWPGPGPRPAGRRPTPLVLALLAATYNTPTVHDLLDFADYEHMPPADRLILDTSVRAEEQAGNAMRPRVQSLSRASAGHADALPHARQLAGAPQVSWRLFLLGLKFCPESLCFDGTSAGDTRSPGELPGRGAGWRRPCGPGQGIALPAVSPGPGPAGSRGSAAGRRPVPKGREALLRRGGPGRTLQAAASPQPGPARGRDPVPGSSSPGLCPVRCSCRACQAASNRAGDIRSHAECRRCLLNQAT